MGHCLVMRISLLVLTAALMLSAGRSASALMVLQPGEPDFGDPTINTTDPAAVYSDFTFWGNAFSSEVYLGNGIFLETQHRGDKPSFTIDGTTFDRVETLGLETTGGTSVNSDLALFRVENLSGSGPVLPNLPTVSPIETPIQPGEFLIMIGSGDRRAQDPTFYSITDVEDIDGQPNAYNNDNWMEVANEANADAKAFEPVGGGSEKRWGTNTAATGPFSQPGIGQRTRVFATEFSLNNATPYEAQGASADSGGPVFVQRNGRWELAGIMHAVWNLDGATNVYPGNRAIGVYDYSGPGELSFEGQTGGLTFVTNLASYQSQMRDFGVTYLDVPPPPVPEPASALVVLAGMLVLGRRRR